MKFTGRLQVEADARNWLKADLTVAKGRVELTSGSDTLGTWATSQVTAERVEGDRFALLLGEEKAMFVADDALGFSYEALPQLNKRQLIPVGGVMDKIKSGLRTEDARSGDRESPPVLANPGDSQATVAGKRLREIIRDASNQPSTQPAYRSDPSFDHDPPQKRASAFEGVFKRRAVARDHEEEAAFHAAPPETPSEAEDLLERLFVPEQVNGYDDFAQPYDWSPVPQEDYPPTEDYPPFEDFPELTDVSPIEMNLPEPTLPEPIQVDAAEAAPDPEPAPSTEEPPTPPPSAAFWDDPVASSSQFIEGGGLDWSSQFAPDDPGARAAWAPIDEPIEEPAAEPLESFPMDLSRQEVLIPIERVEADPLVVALERIVEEARSDSLTPTQVEAIAHLVEVVASAVRTR